MKIAVVKRSKTNGSGEAWFEVYVNDKPTGLSLVATSGQEAVKEYKKFKNITS